MNTAYKSMTQFLTDLGIEQIGHTNSNYLAHLIRVYHDLESWGCSEDVCRAGMFHSIYGTEYFQGFTLPFERRNEIQELIGERAEWIAYLNCTMDRTVFDNCVTAGVPSNRFRNRVTGEELELSDDDFRDLCQLHLCDWLEQVRRADDWDYRRAAYRAMADWLGGIALESYEQVFAEAPA